MKYEEGDVILCKVTDIARTTVFVETLNGTKGSIVLSEIAPGRIRNLREYVVPKKVISCKILNIKDNHLFLSLRRVKTDERRELMDQYKKEKSFQGILKKICGEKRAKNIIEKIKQSQTITEFFEDAKENQKLLEKYFTKEQIPQIKKILETKKEKEKQIKKQFKLSCIQSDGIKKLKEILSPYENIKYLGNSKFSIKIKSRDLKKASHEMNKILEKIEKQAKKGKCDFEVKK